jgi:hypothetical protein
MRFLHTADWQIGMKAAHVGEVGARVREARLDAARRVVERGREAGAHFLLVAGDTFEDNGVERLLVQKVADILGAFPGPVLLIPGNHDPLVPGSVWDHPAWASHANVTVLRDERPVGVPGGALFPCPAREKHSGKDPTAWIAGARAGSGVASGVRIGVAHGTVEGVRQDEPDYPLSREAAVRAGLDYLALGHWHSFAQYASSGAARMAYSGTHETTKFGERDSGNALIVDLASPGAAPSIEPVRTGTLSWTQFDRDVRQPGSLAGLRAELEGIRDPAAALVELRLSGLLFLEDHAELPRLEEILASRFLFGRADRSKLVPAPEADGWLERLPPGPVREAAARLRSLASPVPAGDSSLAATSATASQALLELFALAGESRA